MFASADIFTVSTMDGKTAFAGFLDLEFHAGAPSAMDHLERELHGLAGQQ